MKLFLYFNTDNPRFVQAADRLTERLAGEGISCLRPPQDAASCDAICAIGGDGTILDAAELALQLDLPIFGLNAGRVGFLAAFDEADIPTISAKDIRTLYESRRDVLLVQTEDGRRETAINDVVVSKVDVSKTIQMEISYDDKRLGTYRCDGIIFSTATGSTAYSMSAGGPVVLPDVPATVITPICAYNSAQRSVLVPVETTIRLVMSDRPDEKAVLVADGRASVTLQPGESLFVSKYEKQLKLLLSHERDVYELLSGAKGGN